MKFEYQARTKTGEVQSGTVEAASQEAALAILQKYGFYVTVFQEVKPPSAYAREIRIFGGISGKDRVMFSRQLSILFKTKVPLVESLRTLVGQTANSLFKDKIAKLAETVEGGAPFSKALARFPEVFSPFYIAMVKSGETAGKLSEALDYLADHLEREHDFNSRVMGAMMYPIMVMVTMFGIMFLMIWFVFPQISQFIEETGIEPPLMTKIVFGVIDFIKKWIIVIILTLITLTLFIYQYLKTKEGQSFFSRLSLRVPIVKGLLQMIYLSRFAENLSTLSSGGVQIAQALEVSGEVVGNEIYKKIILETRDAVRKGETIHSVLQNHPEQFPPVFTQMTMVGEKTGTLDETLMHLVTFYQKEVDRGLENILNLLVPLSIVGLGAIVGGLVGSVLLTLYSVVNQMGA
jgi:type IV pilus assembly protein PilC